MHVKMYSKSEREHLHPPGVDMVFGGGRFVMRPESAANLAYGLVTLDRASGSYRRAQLCAVEETMLLEQARAREQAEANDQPAPWSSGRQPCPRAVK